MRKFGRRAGLILCCMLLLATPVAAARELVPGGQVIGIELLDGKVCIGAFDDTLGGPARQAGLRVGDRLVSIDGEKIEEAADVRRAVERSKGTVEVTVDRDGEELKLRLQPQITREGPRLGICLKQGVTGIGTVTWYDPATKEFGALGHGVNTKKGKLLGMEQGNVYRASVADVQKGVSGTPGQLMGSVRDVQKVGTLTKNTRQGLFGRMELTQTAQALPVAAGSEVRAGAATILSTVEETSVQEYSVEILKIYPAAGGAERNMLLKVTDPRLLEATGGIVQGMSGSPIIQDGKLIGAVTHVLVNDPTTGYGIFIENMLDAAA